MRDIPSYCPPIDHQAITSKLFLNKGGNRFQDASVSSGLAKMPGKALGIAFNDVEPDGDIDIVLANDSTPQQLLINQDKATFMDSAMSAGVAYNEDGRSFAGMGVDFEDYDNDARRLLPSLDHAQGWTKRTSGLLYSIRGPDAPLPAESSETIRNS